MQPRTDDYIVIVSIAPFEIAQTLHAGRYIIPAAPERRGDKDPETGLPFTTLKVFDGWVPVANYNRKNPNLVPEPVDCRLIAEDIITLNVRRLPMTTSGRAQWGVAALPEINTDKIPKGFIETLDKLQQNICHRLIDAAETHAEKKEYHLISEPMKMAAIWMGKRAPWLRRDYRDMEIEHMATPKPLFDLDEKASGKKVAATA